MSGALLVGRHGKGVQTDCFYPHYISPFDFCWLGDFYEDALVKLGTAHSCDPGRWRMARASSIRSLTSQLRNAPSRIRASLRAASPSNDGSAKTELGGNVTK